MDQTVVNSGSLLSDMTPPVNPPAEIEDPDDQKPEDWDERPKIQDPAATKPDDWLVPGWLPWKQLTCADVSQTSDTLFFLFCLNS